MYFLRITLHCIFKLDFKMILLKLYHADAAWFVNVINIASLVQDLQTIYLYPINFIQKIK